ncbi:lipopolysaccharide biosynthesis protein [Blastomonas sp.]|uniref:lipopolysaccharide biosynthesis protein n=1 Tax=Blastomonas sp. TaxID=1909299 RepID=UPI0035944A33
MNRISLLRHRVRRLLPETSFLRKLLMLAGGTVAGQAILVLSSPLLTRLFTPAEFGAFAVFAAVVAIAGMGTGLRFELAIPIVRDEADAAGLVGMTVLCTLVTTGLALLFMWQTDVRALINTPDVGLWLWLWLLPLAMLLWGLGSALSFWSVRRGRFAVSGKALTMQFGSQAGSQLAFGFAGAGTPGLIVGFLLGYAARSAYHAVRVPRDEWQLFAAQGPTKIWHSAITNWRYPLMALPSQLLESICQMAPVIIMAWLFGPATAGWYALSQRIMGLPVRVLSEAASQVFLGELRHIESHDLLRFFLRTLLFFTIIGLFGLIPIVILAPPLFALVFGETWRAAGTMVQLLAPLYLLRFVMMPISQVLYYLKRQAFVLLSSILTALAMIGSFSVSYIFALEANEAILLFSLTSSVSLVIYLGVTWIVAKNGSG